MKFRLIIILFVSLMINTLTSCLDGDDMNTPPGGLGPILQMTNNPNGGTLVNSGLRYFGAQALTYPATHEVDTATFAVSLQGIEKLDKDVTVTLSTPADGLDDYFYGDSVVYSMMPDSLYEFIGSPTAVIKAGETYAEFQVKFFPSKVDPVLNFMLPVTVTNDADLPMSSNYGFVYFHFIGNPIAADYDWTYKRWNLGDTVGTVTTTISGTKTFLPDNPTTIEVQSGYGEQNGFNCRYVLSFTNTGGTFTNFKVNINPEDVKNSLILNSITLLQDAVIVKADPVAGHYKFMFKVVNSTPAARSFTDEYWVK
ncbi:MAG TPA: DUF1735 domain-containing protein [Chryseolinea sp.]|nr:DUF1735 domain-containing protein [Chryseolinea sp.]